MDSKKIRYLIWKNNTHVSQQRMRTTISRISYIEIIDNHVNMEKFLKKRFDETKNQFP